MLRGMWNMSPAVSLYRVPPRWNLRDLARRWSSGRSQSSRQPRVYASPLSMSEISTVFSCSSASPDPSRCAAIIANGYRNWRTSRSRPSSRPFWAPAPCPCPSAPSFARWRIRRGRRQTLSPPSALQRRISLGGPHFRQAVRHGRQRRKIGVRLVLIPIAHGEEVIVPVIRMSVLHGVLQVSRERDGVVAVPAVHAVPAAGALGATISGAPYMR